MWRPVVYYASRSMTETEKSYTQIQKEALGSAWAWGKLHLGNKVSNKDSWSQTVSAPTGNETTTSKSSVWFCLHFARFDHSIVYIPCKLLYTIYRLSISKPFSTDQQNDLQLLGEEMEGIMAISVTHLATSAKKINEYCKVQGNDPTCAAVISMQLLPWRLARTSSVLRGYTWQDGKCIVIPKSLKWGTMEKIYIHRTPRKYKDVDSVQRYQFGGLESPMNWSIGGTIYYMCTRFHSPQATNHPNQIARPHLARDWNQPFP